MNLNGQLSPQLPKINLKKFDVFRKEYGSLPSFFETSQQMKSALRIEKIKQSVLEKDHQRQKSKNRNQEYTRLTGQSQPKFQYQTKSLSFHKSSSKTLLTSQLKKVNKPSTQTKSHFEQQSKPKLRQIDSQFILQRMPRLKVSKSQPKLKIVTNTKYENWFPKKNKLRQIQNIRNANYQKVQDFQNSFFLKCRNNSSILKLTRSQQLKT